MTDYGKKQVKTETPAIYSLGFIGALIYFIQHAGSFAEGLLGLLKAVIWPIVLIYKALDFLKA